MTNPDSELSLPSEATPNNERVRRSTPPLASVRLFPVTAAIGLAAIAASISYWAGLDCDFLFLYARAWHGELWRLVTPIFLHVNLLHLAFNLYWLWAFGTAIEQVFGGRVLGGIVLLLAVVSSSAQYAGSVPGIGLSGVAYGLFGFLWVLGRWDPRFAGVVDRRIVQLCLVWFVFCWAMTRAGAWNIGNSAHASGCILGILLGFAWVTRGWRRVGVVAASAGFSVLAIVGGALSPPSASEMAMIGYHDLINEHNDRAAEWYQRALERDPAQADSWYNLGVARQRLEQFDDAAEAFRRAREIRPQDQGFRKAWVDLRAYQGANRLADGEYEAAITIYRDVLKADDNLPECWYYLGIAYQNLDRIDEARDAFRRAIKLKPTDLAFHAALSNLELSAKDKNQP